MRVLMLSWEYPPHVVGGLGKHVEELVPALEDEGVEVHLVTPAIRGGDAREVVGKRFVVHRVDLADESGGDDFFAVTKRANALIAAAAREVIDEEGPFDLIHAHDWLVGFAATALKHEERLPLLVTIHATEWGRARGHLHSALQQAIHNAEWQLTYEAWRVIACSGYMANEIMNIFQVPHDKLEVIPNGIHTDRFDKLDGVDLTDLRNRFALPKERIVFAVGRVVYEKGFHVLVDAAPYVLNAIPDAKFVLAGRGPALDDLQRRAAENGLGPKFHFAGFVPDEVRDGLLKLCDAAVFPSLYEPFGIVALEAMAAKAPVVVSSVGGLGEVVRHGETGITTFPDDPKSLAWGILHTLQYPYWSRKRVQNAYEEVTRIYNWRVIAESTAKTYEHVIRDRKSSAW